MSTKNKDQKSMTRRDFVKGAAVAAAGVAAMGAGALASPAQAQTTAQPWLPAKWDYETDVVVVGMGFAGQTVALEATKAGAAVLVLEKAPEELAGGNSRVCGQCFIAPKPETVDAGYFDYLKFATSGQGFPVNPDPAVADATLKFYLAESYNTLQWYKDMGAEVAVLAPPKTSFPFFPHFPGAEAVASDVGAYTVKGKFAGPGSLWYAIQDQLIAKKVKILYSTPVTKLVQDPVTKEVFGVVAISGGKEEVRKDGGGIDVTGGKKIYVKAKKGVAVCNGGFEYNQQMQRDFQGVAANYSPGSPYNTGEGIKMCWEAGANLRNMGVRNAPTFSYGSIGVKPQFKAAIAVGVSSTETGATGVHSKGAAITIGANNKRYRDEFNTWTKTCGIANRAVAGKEFGVVFNGHFVQDGVYVREKAPMPMFYIFDEVARKSGTAFASSNFAIQLEGYKPSADNSQELKWGWIIQADTIEELEKKIGRPADPLFFRVPLKETIDRWNKMCEAKKDEDWGRTVNLTPFTTGPFYAIQYYPQAVNTQGGPVRTDKGEVLDLEGKAIPRLYAAGENGDIWTWLYQCCANVGAGCFGYGRAVAKEVVKLKPWGTT